MYDLFCLLVEVLRISFQGYYLMWFYGQFMETRFHKYRGNRVLIVLIWVLGRTVTSVFWKTGYDPAMMQIKWLAAIVLLVLATMVLYDADWKLKLYLPVTFFAVTGISFFLGHLTMELGQVIFPFWSWCLMKGYFSSTDTFMILVHGSAITLQLIMSAVSVLLMRFGLRNIAGRYREKEYEIHRTELLFILTPGAAGLLICNLLQMLMITVEDRVPMTLYERYPGMLLLVPAILILSFFSVLSGIKIFQDMISLNREKSNRIILEKQMGNIQEHIGEMERVYGNMRSIRHDMKNHLAVLTQMLDRGTGADREEIKDYLAEIEQTVRGLEFRFRTGNTVADTILNMKYHEAVRLMPELRMEADRLVFPRDCQIQSYDIAVILCNLIDNAVEACGRISGSSPWIRLSSMERGRLFFLEAANSFDGRISITGQREFPQTDKKDREAHGMGLYNIKAAVERYEGAVDWMIQERTFILHIMIKNERKCRE